MGSCMHKAHFHDVICYVYCAKQVQIGQFDVMKVCQVPDDVMATIWNNDDVTVNKFIMFIAVLALFGTYGPNACHEHGENHQSGQGTCLASHLCKVA